ncbi:MAG: NAD(+) diphosphatase [Gammaproteobacteria bacterium]
MSNIETFFSGSNVLRASEVRASEEALERAFYADGTQFVVVWRAHCLVEKKRAHLLPLEALKLYQPTPGGSTFLGHRDGTALFAVSADGSTEPPAPVGAAFLHLRELIDGLSVEDAGLLAYARSVVSWQLQHRFCGSCGSPANLQDGGFVMACGSDACGQRSFPRLDPAIIVLVSDQDRCLLGRQKTWPDGRYSTIAGFVEPGESLEEAVRREVLEETNIRVGNCRYFASQPWPFPYALMIGYHAQAVSSDIRLNDDELGDAQWLSREAIAAGDYILPQETSIAFQLIEHWFDQWDGTPLKSLNLSGSFYRKTE